MAGSPQLIYNPIPLNLCGVFLKPLEPSVVEAALELTEVAEDGFELPSLLLLFSKSWESRLANHVQLFLSFLYLPPLPAPLLFSIPV